jgi:cytochrome b subunit of formate dehydrogenase
LHAVGLLLLLATGLLLYSPTLRITFTGGYSLTLRWLHRWIGVGFLVVPTLLVVFARWLSARRPVDDRGPPWALRWRQSHVPLTVSTTAAFAGTGAVLSLEAHFSRALLDLSRSLHIWLTYASVAMLGIHFFVALAYPSQRPARPRQARTRPADAGAEKP